MTTKAKTDRPNLAAMNAGSLREYAKGIGVKFGPRSGEERMREKIEEYWAIRDAQNNVAVGTIGDVAAIVPAQSEASKPVSAPPAVFSGAQEPVSTPRQRKATKAAVPPVQPVAAAPSSTPAPTKVVKVPAVKGGRPCMGRWDDGTGVASHRMQQNDGPAILCGSCVGMSQSVNDRIKWVPIGG